MLMERSLSDDARTVLRLVSKEAADGFTIQKRTGLNGTTLLSALNELVKNALVRVEGDLNPSAVGRSYVWVPPTSKGYAELLSGVQ